ncbi:CIA30 family protein [Lutimonas vermicola]|uniref:CIA30 family protein n=1 Tax=Lutimonas vermicola TaxID=414288 RepID=A0ABU9KY29_9FLAO
MSKFILLLILIQTSMQEKMTIFDFSQETSSSGWYVVNDGVMGGLSKGQFSRENDMAVFKGDVSTDNNGGFTMIQNQFETIKTNKFKAFTIRLKGDGKDYQFRVRSDKNQQHSYVYQFSTTGEWQEISVPFSSLAPRFRGRSLEMPNFDGAKIEEIAFLIGNKKKESFKLLLDRVSVE